MSHLAPLVFIVQVGVATWLTGPLARASDAAAASLAIQAAVVAAAALLGAWLSSLQVLQRWASPTRRTLRRVACALAIAFLPSMSAALPSGLIPLLATVGLLVGPELRAMGALLRDERPPPWWSWLAFLLCALAAPFLAPYLDARRAALLIGLLTVPWALADAPGPVSSRERNIFGAMLCILPGWIIALALGALVTLVLCFVLALTATLSRTDRITRELSLSRAAAIASVVLVAVTFEGAIRTGYPLSFVDPEFPVVRAQQLGGEWLLLRARDAAAADLAFHGEKGAFLDRLAERRVAEALVHPTLSTSRRRRRILLIGGECTQTVQEILRYPDVEEVAQIVLYPHWWRFCRDVPLLAPPADKRVKIYRITTTKALVRQFKKEGENSFDAAIVNVPETVAWPAKTHTAGFHSALRGLVRPGGRLGARLADLRRPAFTGCLWATVRLWWPQTRLGHVLAHLVGSLTTDTILIFGGEEALDPSQVRFPLGTRAFSNENRDLIFSFGADRRPWKLRAPPPEDCTQFLPRSRS